MTDNQGRHWKVDRETGRFMWRQGGEKGEIQTEAEATGEHAHCGGQLFAHNGWIMCGKCAADLTRGAAWRPGRL